MWLHTQDELNDDLNDKLKRWNGMYNACSCAKTITLFSPLTLKTPRKQWRRRFETRLQLLIVWAVFITQIVHFLDVRS
jgi:hypothetical protein